jgi:hypothetical protein
MTREYLILITIIQTFVTIDSGFAEFINVAQNCFTLLGSTKCEILSALRTIKVQLLVRKMQLLECGKQKYITGSTTFGP